MSMSPTELKNMSFSVTGLIFIDNKSFLTRISFKIQFSKGTLRNRVRIIIIIMNRIDLINNLEAGNLTKDRAAIILGISAR